MSQKLSTAKKSSLSPELQDKLIAAARAAERSAYAPYSNFHVGAAVLTEAGSIFTGCNVENASYGLTNCAERNAIGQAITAEGRGMKLLAVAVTCSADVPCAPCGACRQVIAEFSTPKTLVVFPGANGMETLTVAELLPHGFRF